MAIEAERKFIMRPDYFFEEVRTLSARRQALAIEQHYFALDGFNFSQRVRITDGRSAKFTIKGQKINGAGDEFEYDIPVSDARQIAEKYCGGSLKKIRFLHEYQFRTYEVDEIHATDDSQNVLYLAELEGSADGPESIYTVPLPSWAIREVTDDTRYSSASIAFFGLPR